MAGFGEVDEILRQLIIQEPGLNAENSHATSNLFRRVSSTLKHSKYLQTNQFEVWKRLAGLDERLRIRNNDELADALHVRVEAVKSPTTEWLPEVLSLLLHLSKDPANESRIESLNELDREPESPPLTWQEIFQDDPLDNTEDLWDIPNYGEASSDETEVSTPQILAQEPRFRRKEVKRDDQVLLEAALDHGDIETSLLEDLRCHQFWRKPSTGSESAVITEIQIIREAIFMLLGLPTIIFNKNQAGDYEPSSVYALVDVSSQTLADNLASFANIGSRVSVIRTATKTKNKVSFVQTFQSSLAARLSAVEHSLDAIQARIISPLPQESISLIDILGEVQLVARPLLTLCGAATLVIDPHGQHFAVLEALYDLILHLQSIDDLESYHFATDILLECLSTYLKPISSWMESGNLNPEDNTFFVGKSGQDIPLGQIWTNQYKLVKSEGDTLWAPRFLHLAAKKIFNTGKSIIVLRLLGQNLNGSDQPLTLKFPDLLRTHLASQSLCPFEEIFTAALDAWITSQYHSYSSILRSTLETSCGLWKSIDAIQHLYFHCNGHISSDVASGIFARIDARRGRMWHDRFILTDMHREKYAPVPSIETTRLAITVVPLARQSNIQGNRSVKDLSKMSIIYTVPWSISNIIKPSAFGVFQSVSTLLLQISRAKHLLRHIHDAYSTTKIRVSHKNRVNVMSLSLHHRFLWFVDVLYGHLTNTVLLQASASMRESMKAAQDVDQMIEVYEAFVQQVGEECFVNAKRADVRKAIVSVLDLTVLFEGIGTMKVVTGEQPRAKRKCETDGADESEGSGLEDEAVLCVVPQRQDSAIDAGRLEKISGTFDRLLQFIIASIAQIRQEPSGDGHRSQALLDNLSFRATKS